MQRNLASFYYSNFRCEKIAEEFLFTRRVYFLHIAQLNCETERGAIKSHKKYTPVKPAPGKDEKTD
jgi:hypothetical protein